MQGKSPDELKAAMSANKVTMEAERKSLEDWAKQNGIDIKYLTVICCWTSLYPNDQWISRTNLVTYS